MQSYFNYLNSVLGLKHILTHQELEPIQTQFTIVTHPLKNADEKEMFFKIMQAIDFKNYQHLEIRAIGENLETQKPPSIQLSDCPDIKWNHLYLVFGFNLKSYLQLSELQVSEQQNPNWVNCEKSFDNLQDPNKSPTLYWFTNGISEMIENPNLKQDCWQSLKQFKNHFFK